MADIEEPMTTETEPTPAAEEQSTEEERPAKKARVEGEDASTDTGDKVAEAENGSAEEAKPTGSEDATKEEEEKKDVEKQNEKPGEKRKDRTPNKNKGKDRDYRHRNEASRSGGSAINLPSMDDGKEPRAEKDVGITSYVTKHRGFHGVIKQRFSDFIVREIDMDRHLVVLNEMSLPQLPEREKTPVPEIPIDEETLKALKEMDEGKPKTDKGIEIDVTGNTKEERKGIHSRINETFSTLSSTTKLKDDKTYIVVAKKSSKIMPKRSNFRWPVVIDGVDNYYTHFTLHKENRETQECIFDLASRLRLEPSKFSFAGTKDRRAKTTQRMSVFRVSPDALLEAVKQVQRIKVGNFKFAPERVELGALKGNKFSIVLRNLVCADTELDEIMGNLRDRGFINYYGMQRFGTHKKGTHEIGREMLKGNWEEAVEFILRPRDRDEPDMQRARRVWQLRHDAGEAFKCLRSRARTIEGKLWIGLMKSKNNFKKAVEALPRNVRLLYLHAYQSYVWNQVASRRSEKHDLNVIPGDLVLPVDDFDIEEDELIESESFNEEDESRDKKEEREKRHNVEAEEERPAKKVATEPAKEESKAEEDGAKGEEKPADVETTEKTEESTEAPQEEPKDDATKTEVDATTKPEEPAASEPAPESKEETTSAEEERRKKRRQVPVMVTEEDLAKYTVYDIVLPLPGDEVVYPQNECAEWYKEFLAKDGIKFEDIEKHAKSYCLYGGYRRFIQRPIDLTYKKVRYNDVTLPLIQSDIDILDKVEPKGAVEDGRYEALVVEFSLPASGYATMALREAMKTETSAQHQSSLNDYYKKFIEDY